MTTNESSSNFEDTPDRDPGKPGAIGVPSGIGHPLRPARALIGWMPPGTGEQVLASSRMDIALDEQQAKLQKARDAVAARPAGIDQDGLVADLPPLLADHVDRLRATPAGEQMFSGGWEVKIVDLDRVVAFQPFVFTDTAVQRVEVPDVDDLEAIAKLTLPTEHTAAIQVHHDQLTQTYVIRSPNPNLKVMGNLGAQAGPNGAPLFGFIVGELPSFVQVINVGGRYVLNDGYHRAFGLLSRGITRVPAFVRSIDTSDIAVPINMLPRGAWTGDRPPVLRDYHDDVLTETVYLPAAQKMVVISATELALPS